MIQKWVSSLSIYRGLPHNIYFLALARVILGMGNFIIPFLVLLLTDKLGYSATLAGSLAMGVTATYFFGGFLGGKLSDLYGHKNIMVAGELLGSLFIFACGFVADAPILVPAGLLVAYFLMGVAVPASNALVADLSHRHNRDAVMSLSYLAYNFGSAIGPIIAGYLFWSHTQWIFFGNGLAVFVGIVIVARYIKLPKEQEHEHTSELEQPVQGNVWSVLKARPRLFGFTVLCGLLWYALNQMTMASPLYLSHLLGEQGPIVFGQLMTYACVVVVMITPLLMALTSNQVATVSLAYAGLLFILGYGLVMLLPTIPVHFVAWLFLSAGEVLLLTKEGVYLANNSPSSHRGRIQGVLVTLRSVLVMPSFVVIGFLIDHFGYRITWLSVMAIALIAVVGFYFMPYKTAVKTRHQISPDR
ncbi:MFS transporter [Vibrio palustris]|uniref:Putative 3-hydroxyphenylpropionic transporter MhpT n=1 Tax=Vibrio palustris TaxID=1918946 RepID=A0A1R4B548_9VIBR|nr:MFS transporter [Vibrio palustris]SJL84052.1 putative 3-hydroxyphenylpropionic transporter MhpT [Vibrio palustris]